MKLKPRRGILQPTSQTDGRRSARSLSHRQRVIASALSLAFVACGDDDEPDPGGNPLDAGAADLSFPDMGSAGSPDTGVSVAGGSVRFSVAYTGAEMGTLALALYVACPPDGPPIGFRDQRIENPAFPLEFDFDGVSPGSYFAAATLDIGDDNPALPGPEDILACSPSLTVTAEEGAFAPIDLDNPL